jgi:hypothetical protein
MLCCTSIIFFSRPVESESGVICMAGDDFARVVATKEGETKTKQFLIGEKLLELFLPCQCGTVGSD